MNETAVSNLLIFIGIIVGVLGLAIILKFFSMAKDVKDIRNYLANKSKSEN